MCKKCDELQRAVEQKQRCHERTLAMMDGFFGPSATTAERNHRAAQMQEADRVYAELQDARAKMAEHKKEHEA
jgi:hypothetical protein